MSFMFGQSQAAPPPPPALPDPLPSPPSYATGGTKGGAGPGGNAGKVPGFGSTLLTSASGVDSSSTNTARKSLLGQ